MIEVPSGDDLVAALAGAGQVVAGFGEVEGVELRVVGEATEVTRALRGSFTLAHLAAVDGRAFAVVSRATDAGLETLAGRLMRARSLGVTLLSGGAATPAVEPPEEPTRRREAPLGKIAAALGEATASSWRDVAEVSEEAEERADATAAAAALEADADEIGAGDIVDHFSFGLCDVLTSDGERLRIRDKHGPGRIREVAVEMLEVTRAPGRDGKRCWRLMKRR